MTVFLIWNDDYVSTNNVKFYFDYQNGVYGYNTSSSRGADTFSPFKSGAIIDNLGKITTYNASSISGYQNFTVNNFIVAFLSTPYTNTNLSGNDKKGQKGYARAYGCTASKSYNASTGIFSLSGMSQSIAHIADDQGVWASTTQSINYTVYLVH